MFIEIQLLRMYHTFYEFHILFKYYPETIEKIYENVIICKSSQLTELIVYYGL